MSASGIRDLSPEELALISGGAQMDTNDLPPVEVRPPDDWGPNPGPPDFTNPPFDPGPGGGGGGASDPSFTFTDVKPFESKLTYTPGEGAILESIRRPSPSRSAPALDSCQQLLSSSSIRTEASRMVRAR